MDLMGMSVSGALFIVAVVVIRAAALDKLPKKTFLILWGLVLARLLFPFSIPSAFSVNALFGSGQAGLSMSRVRLFLSDVQMLVMRVLSGAALTETKQTSGSGDFTVHEQAVVWQGMAGRFAADDVSAPVSVWLVVWCAGMLLLLLYFATAYVRCLAKFRTALPVCNEFVESWLLAHPCRRPISVRQTDRIAAPLTYGILRPVILLPKTTDWENMTQLQYVLAHEHVHIRRYDTATKLAATAALCIHWFNPFVWVMYVLFNRDLELACDESVIRQCGEQSKSAYALMLIGMEEQKSGLSPLCNNFSKNLMEERIEAIMKTKKTTLCSLVLAGAIVAGTTMVFATSAKADNSGEALTGNQKQNATVTETSQEEGTLLSYVNPQDGKTYYSVDNGESFETLTEEEFEKRYPMPVVEWWTYEEYKTWLENEKKQLQNLIGEKAWTGSRGEFVWTQEIVDETVAMYEGILQDIKNGMRVSKSVDGDDDYLAGGKDSYTARLKDLQCRAKMHTAA